jgi:hypothetical protein
MGTASEEDGRSADIVCLVELVGGGDGMSEEGESNPRPPKKYRRQRGRGVLRIVARPYLQSPRVSLQMNPSSGIVSKRVPGPARSSQTALAESTRAAVEPFLIENSGGKKGRSESAGAIALVPVEQSIFV